MINFLDNARILKLWEKIRQDNKLSLFFIAACLISIIFSFVFILRWQLENIRKLNPKIAQLKKDLNDFHKNLSQMQEMNSKQMTLGQLFKTKRLISEAELSGVLVEISNMANKNEVKIAQIKPSKDEQAEKQQKDPAIAKFTPFLINLDLFCGYHQLGKLINDLENAEVFLAVQSIDIMPQQIDYLVQKVSLVLRTYAKK